MTDLSLQYGAQAEGTLAYGDLTVINGDLLLTSDAPMATAQALGTEPITQAIVQACRTVLGEYWLDVSLGVPFYQDLLGKAGSDTMAFETALQQAILSTPGVIGLSSWSISVQKAFRRVSLTFTTTCTTGVVTWSGTLNPNV